jgi:hypothetical protein
MYNVEKNNGMEASTYLKYCMDSYGDFKEYTIFLHDEEFSWHHEGSIIDRIAESVGFDGKYKTLNNAHNLPYFYSGLGPNLVNCISFYNRYVAEYLGPIDQYGEFLGPSKIGAAQMIIRRDALESLPFEFYCDIYSWYMAMDAPTFDHKKDSAIIMEYLWELIWNPTPIVLKTL